MACRSSSGRAGDEEGSRARRNVVLLSVCRPPFVGLDWDQGRAMARPGLSRRPGRQGEGHRRVYRDGPGEGRSSTRLDAQPLAPLQTPPSSRGTLHTTSLPQARLKLTSFTLSFLLSARARNTHTGTNLLNSQTVAIKFEPRKSDAPQLRDEYRSYKILSGCSTSLKFYCPSIKKVAATEGGEKGRGRPAAKARRLGRLT
jgi:hypothetical protein